MPTRLFFLERVHKATLDGFAADIERLQITCRLQAAQEEGMLQWVRIDLEVGIQRNEACF